MTQHAATYIQRAFRGRNDDGSESAATWIVAENIDWTQEGNGLFRVRFGVRQDTSNADTNLSKQFKLKFSHAPAGFVDVGAQSASGIAVRYGDSSHLTDDEVTTEQLLIGDQFVAGRVLEVAPTGAITFPSGTRSLTEIEAVLEIVASEVSDDDTIVLRIYESDDTALSSYEQAPTITIGSPAVEELTVAGVLPDLDGAFALDAVGGAVSNMEILTNAGAARIASDAAFNPVDDIELRVDLAADWATGVVGQVVNRYTTTGNNRQWQVVFNQDGTRALRVFLGTGTGTFRDSVDWSQFPGLGFADGERIQVRVRLDADDGAGDTAIEFSYRQGADIGVLDNDTNWTVDQTVVMGGVQSWKNTTEPLILANRIQMNQVLDGQYHRLIFWTDLTKTTRVADLDFTDPDNRVGGANDTWADAISANNWEMQGVEDTDWVFSIVGAATLVVTGILPGLAASATLAASADLAVAGTLPDLVGSVTAAAGASAVVAGQLPGLVGAFTLDAAADTFDPTGAELDIIGTTAFITWDASPTPGVEDYQVFRRTPQTGDPFDPEVDTPIATGIVGTSYDDEGLAVDDYDWQVFGRVPA